MKVLLTVPHGCDGCDVNAPKYAERVSRNLDKLGVKNTVLVSTTKRTAVDMNRPMSRSTTFRQKVSAAIAALRRDDVLLDIHSFPNDEKTPREIYFLDILSLGGDDSFIRAFRSYLEMKGVNVSILDGSTKNDIVVEALRDGKKNVALVEIDDALPSSRAGKIASLVASFASASRTAVVSPTYGVITGISSNTVTIYIDIDDDHNIFAPIGGKIERIVAKSGDFDRYLKIFKSWEKKRGRLTVGIGDVDFLVEVGEGYVTDRVKLRKASGDKVKRGEPIGNIVLGSLSEVKVPAGHDILVKEGEAVAGGETIISIKRKTK